MSDQIQCWSEILSDHFKKIIMHTDLTVHVYFVYRDGSVNMVSQINPTSGRGLYRNSGLQGLVPPKKKIPLLT